MINASGRWEDDHPRRSGANDILPPRDGREGGRARRRRPLWVEVDLEKHRRKMREWCGVEVRDVLGGARKDQRSTECVGLNARMDG